MQLSIIIVNFNTKDILKNCLDSAMKNSEGVDYEVIVVDNASSDGSQDLVRKEFSRVKLICNRENLGFAKANNQGIKAAKGKYLLLLNSDTILLDKVLVKALSFIEDRKDAGIVGCKVLNPDRTLQFSCYHFPGFMMELLFFTKDIIKSGNNPFAYYRYMKYWDHGTIRKVDCLAGCFLLIKKEVFDEAGYLDEKFFMYHEDSEFCLRVKRRTKYKVYYYPEPEIIHFGGMSIDKDNFEVIKQSYNSARYYLRSRYNASVETYFNILCSLIWQLEIMLFSCLSFNKKFDKKLKLLKVLKSHSNMTEDDL